MKVELFRDFQVQEIWGGFIRSFFCKAVGFFVSSIAGVGFGPLKRSCGYSLFEDAGSFLEEWCIFYTDPMAHSSINGAVLERTTVPALSVTKMTLFAKKKNGGRLPT